MFRNQAGSTWRRKALAFTVSAALGGAALGALLGWLGGTIAEPLRAGAAVALGAAAVPVALLGLAGRPVRVLQRSKETPQRWMHHGPMGWALRNGLALGTGATSRIEFWLWYAVPLTALLLAQPVLGGALYALYGAVRAGGVWVLLLRPAPRQGGRGNREGDQWPGWALGLGTARFTADLQLLLVGIAVLVTAWG